MPDKNEKKNDRSLDGRFIAGLALTVFLVIVHTTLGEIPIYLVAIPALIMGVDISAIIEAWRGKK